MLEGIVRESTSKKATKELRNDGYLIANIYGVGVENVNAAFKKNDFIRYVRNKPELKFPVKVGDTQLEVVIQEYQKHPVTSDLLHVDLRTVTGDKEARFLVPVKTTGTPVGLKNKGLLMVNKKRIPVKCKASDLPSSFTLEVGHMDVGANILARDIKAPEGVTIMLNNSVAVVGVIKAK